MKKNVIGSIVISIIIMCSIIIGGMYYLKRMELPPVIPFIILNIIVFFILLSINFAVIKKSKQKSRVSGHENQLKEKES